MPPGHFILEVFWACQLAGDPGAEDIAHMKCDPGQNLLPLQPDTGYAMELIVRGS